MKGPNFRSVKESNLKLGPKEQDQGQKLNRKESCNKRVLNKKKTGGIDSFFAKSDNENQVVKDERELIKLKNKEILRKARKEPEKDVSISWESKSSRSSKSIVKGGFNSYRELEDLLRTLEVEGAGAGIMIWEGFFNSVRKLIKEVQELKDKVIELSKAVSQEESKSEKEEKNLVNKMEFEMDKKLKRKEERIKAYKEEGTWLEEDQWKLLNDGQKALKRFSFSDRHQNMDPIQFNQLTFEEKESFILSKLQWRLKRRRELLDLKEKDEDRLQVEKALRDLEFFNGRYFDYRKKRWKKFRFNDWLLERTYYEKKSRSWNGSSDPYYL